MVKNTILIFDSLPDLETDLVISKLNKRPVKIKRISSYALQDNSFTLIPGEANRLPFDIDNVISVFNRMPFSVAGVISGNESPEQKFTKEEQYWFIRNLYQKLENVFWINDLIAEEKANRKLLQLETAKDAGLNIPETLITNNSKDVLKFYNKYQEILFKPIFHSGQLSSKDNSYIFASKIKRKDLEYLENLKSCPGVFQRFVDKEYDLRIIIIGKDIFPVAIQSQSVEDGKIDWRKARFSDLECKLTDTTKEIRDSCYNLCRRFGIITAAIDFAVDREGKHYFLDLNPGGRWMQFEFATGIKFSDSLADILANPSSYSSDH